MTDQPYVIKQPEIRTMLVPDEGYVLIEADLARADAQVVAWDSNCPGLKDVFRKDLDLHTINARWLYDRDDVHSMHINHESFRQNAKRAVHLTHYAGQKGTLSGSLAINPEKAERFIRWYAWETFPEVHQWHERIEYELRSRRYPIIYNAFGFRKMFTDRFNNHTVAQALAWIGQGTVAIVINHCLIQLDAVVGGATNWGARILGTFKGDPLLQVHDSVLLEAPRDTFPDICEPILEAMKVTIPYEDPLVIGSEIKYSFNNWGEMKKWSPQHTIT